MAVQNVDCIDQVAISPDGRLILVMVEEREYGNDSDVLIEDFRRKLNSYIRSVRFGRAQTLAQQAGIKRYSGVDIVLSSNGTPVEAVQHMIAMVNHGLSADRICARWESWAPDDVGAEVVERALVDGTVESLMGDWRQAVLWFRLDSMRNIAGIKVELADGMIVDLPASDQIMMLLSEYWRVSNDICSGESISGRLVIETSGEYRVSIGDSC